MAGPAQGGRDASANGNWGLLGLLLLDRACPECRFPISLHPVLPGPVHCPIAHTGLDCKCQPIVPDSIRIPKNWLYSPSVYNSRVSSVVPSGTPIGRPKGVFYQPGTEQVPKYGPSEALDFELEMGYFVSKPVPFGEVMDISDAKEHIFGFVLLNDWSARDLQMFEMKPLGPFHGKGSASASNSECPFDILVQASGRLSRIGSSPLMRSSPLAAIRRPYRTHRHSTTFAGRATEMEHWTLNFESR